METTGRGFKKEPRYVVLAIKDIKQYLTKSETMALNSICEQIVTKRLLDDKKVNEYVVVNQDEPYAHLVWQLIQRDQEPCKHYREGDECAECMDATECGICSEYEEGPPEIDDEEERP